MANTENSIDALNALIEINNDRIEGYETAISETEETDLKALFSRCQQTSQICKAELIKEVKRLGGTPVEGTKTTGKIYRAWMEFKAMVTGKDRKSVLNSCEYGEDVALDTYREVLDNHLDDLTNEQNGMINVQFTLIKADHDKVRSLRDMVSEYK